MELQAYAAKLKPWRLESKTRKMTKKVPEWCSKVTFVGKLKNRKVSHMNEWVKGIRLRMNAGKFPGKMVLLSSNLVIRDDSCISSIEKTSLLSYCLLMLLASVCQWYSPYTMPIISGCAETKPSPTSWADPIIDGSLLESNLLMTITKDEKQATAAEFLSCRVVNLEKSVFF